MPPPINGSFNLDIHSYSLPEIYALFDLPPVITHTLTLEELKRAKKKVLMTHPDKSRLPPEYFLFYKRALETVVHHYNEQNKQNQPVIEQKYTIGNNHKTNDAIEEQVRNSISSMKKGEFHRTFNKLFEETMVKPSSSKKNEWFSQITPPIQRAEAKTRTQINDAIERQKELQRQYQQQRGMVLYKGVQPLQSSIGKGLYEEDEEAEEDEEGNVKGDYITADIFSALKYEDVRKVHKDQTVFDVSEREYRTPEYRNIEEFQRVRGRQNITPMNTSQAREVLTQQENQYREEIMKKQHIANRKTEEYEEKNKAVLSRFLRIEDNRRQ